MKNTCACVAGSVLCLALVGSVASAEIITNVFNQPLQVGLMNGSEFDTGAGFSLDFGFYIEQGVGYITVGVGVSPSPDISHMLSGYVPEGLVMDYDIGWDEVNHNFIVGNVAFGNGGSEVDMWGEPGSVGYIRFGDWTGDSSPAAHSLGYLQIVHQESHWDLIGWSMATEESDFGNYQVVNLIPSPSGIAVFGIAGLGLGYRRRR